MILNSFNQLAMVKQNGDTHFQFPLGGAVDNTPELLDIKCRPTKQTVNQYEICVGLDLIF